MSGAAIGLVIGSAASHAGWNFLMKRAGGGWRFLTISKVAEAVLFLPVLLFVAPAAHVSIGPLLFYGIASTIFALGTNATITAAYRRGDMALVYPAARGSMLLFLPLLALVMVGEQVSGIGAAGMIFIVAGLACLPLVSWTGARQAFADGVGGPAMKLALAHGFIAAVSALWDKRALGVLPAFQYFYSYNIGTTTAMAAHLSVRERFADVRDEWRRHWLSIVVVAALNTTSYLLLLAAFKLSAASYAIALRQLGIVFGAVLGWRILGEPMHGPRLTGLMLVLVGCLLAAVAM